ncbi:MAG: glycosyltransferase family 4 protein [Candidatus Omnitrophica bacterium]|nr:glycosyltransferase family 4 protein [Candidatus Omnitrophota bacterium]
MHILFLTTRLPFPPIGGERLRPFYFIKYFCLKHKITLLSFIESKEELLISKSYNSESLQIKTVYLPKWKSYFNCLRGLFEEFPLEISYYNSKEMQDLIYEELNKKKFDILFCHLIRMANYVKDIKIKKILDLCDALSLRYSISSSYRRDIFKLIEIIESQRLKRYEQKIVLDFDLNLVASNSDKQYYENNLGIKNIYVLPNGVEIEENLNKKGSNSERIIFFANFRTYPNQDAIIYFYKKIFPIIKKELKNIKLIVVGTYIPKYIYSLFKDDACVEVYQNVSDTKPFIQSANVSVAPMRIAVGIQNKILQSMALKVPVVATSMAKAGIDASAEKEIILADEPEDFAYKVIRLIKDKELNFYIAENAFRLIKERYQWQNIVADLEDRCLKLIS